MPSVPAGYQVIQELALSPQGSSARGWLQLLEDERLSPELRQELWGDTIDPAHAEERRKLLAADHPQLPAAPPADLRPAWLRLYDETGAVLFMRPLTSKLAGIEDVQLYGDARSSILLTESDIGTGRRSGRLTTSLFEISGDHWHDVNYLPPSGPPPGPPSGPARRFGLIASRNAAWRLVEARDNDGKDIEAIECSQTGSVGQLSPHGGHAPAPSDLTYSTYRFDGAHWRKFVQHHPGCWEDDQDFPPQGDFP